MQKLVAEGFGTTLLLATVIGSDIMGAPHSPENDAVALLANAVAAGAILCVLITIFGPISGAHFNPVVTLAILLQKELEGLCPRASRSPEVF